MRTGHRVTTALATVVMALGLIGCGDDDDAPENAADLGTDLTEDDTSMPEGGDGGAEEANPFGNVELPDAIPLPEDHEILQAIGNPDDGYTVILESPMGVSDAVDFYERELPDAGWESVESRDAGRADVMMVEAQRAADDHNFGIQISGRDDGTSMQIYTGPPGG